VLVRSDSVAHLTAAGRDAVAAYGVTTVIDLRSPSELLASPNPFAGRAGPRFLNVPLVDDATMVGLGEASGMFERYLMMLERRPDALRAIFEAIAEADGGVVFHCFAGKDRTGLVAAILLSIAGVEDEAIGDDFAETDAQLAAKYEEWLAAAAPERREEMRDELQCPPDRILGVLAHLRKGWGGVENYLQAAGMSPANLDRLSNRLA
jgi:protein-tyrosine phosphatase